MKVGKKNQAQRLSERRGGSQVLSISNSKIRVDARKDSAGSASGLVILKEENLGWQACGVRGVHMAKGKVCTACKKGILGISSGGGGKGVNMGAGGRSHVRGGGV